MTGVAYCAAVFLAGVFVVAGAAKVRTPRATASTFERLGVPVPRVLARAVPALELVVATALLAAPRAGAVAAFVLLGAFTAVLARAVARGLDVSCGCFGAASHSAVTAVTLLRNGLLLVVAATVLAFGSAPVRPSLAAVVLTSTTVLLGGIAVTAADVRRSTGALWKLDAIR